jgi:hypothetical protein
VGGRGREGRRRGGRERVIWRVRGSGERMHYERTELRTSFTFILFDVFL